jgi:hypothetical protein
MQTRVVQPGIVIVGTLKQHHQQLTSHSLTIAVKPHRPATQLKYDLASVVVAEDAKIREHSPIASLHRVIRPLRVTGQTVACHCTFADPPTRATLLAVRLCLVKDAEIFDIE